MKAKTIFYFILLMIAILACIASIFPTKGIQFFSKVLRFPSVTEILTKSEEIDIDPEEVLKQWEVAQISSISDSIQSQAKAKTTATQIQKKDTLQHIENEIEKVSSTFELPNQNLKFFNTFFAKANAARANQKTVRVLYYGDSQIELDRFSDCLREFLQKKFGGGGIGFVPLVQTIPTGAISQSYSGGSTSFALWGDTRRNKERDYGPMAKMFRILGTNTFSAYANKKKNSSDLRQNYSSISLLINSKTNNFSASLNDKTNKANYTVQSDTSGMQMLQIPLNFSSQSFSISLNGSADVYGVLIDDGYGVAVDNISMRGASGLHFTSMNDSLLRKAYKMLDVGMIILQYGGNAVPGLYGTKSVDNYVANIVLQIKYLQRVAPNTPILFIGPSDMLSVVDGKLQSYKHLAYLVQRLHEEIPNTGAAFWNMYEVMGGANSMRSWVKKGWAGKDYVHFTSKGATEISKILTQTFEAMYEYWEMNK